MPNKQHLTVPKAFNNDSVALVKVQGAAGTMSKAQLSMAARAHKAAQREVLRTIGPNALEGELDAVGQTDGERGRGNYASRRAVVLSATATAPIRRSGRASARVIQPS